VQNRRRGYHGRMQKTCRHSKASSGRWKHSLPSNVRKTQYGTVYLKGVTLTPEDRSKIFSLHNKALLTGVPISNREIGRRVFINHKTVAKYRNAIVTLDLADLLIEKNYGAGVDTADHEFFEEDWDGISREEDIAIQWIVASKPDVYLRELQSLLHAMWGRWWHTSTIWRRLKVLGYSHKKLSKMAAQRLSEVNMKYRVQFLGFIPLWPVDRIFFYDEAAFTEIERTYGWGLVGLRSEYPVYKKRPSNISVLGTINNEGLFSYELVDENVNSFYVFRHLYFVICYMPQGSLLVMDNARTHQSVYDALKLVARARHCDVVMLPPYSPDLNPIEQMWNEVKTYVKGHAWAYRSNRVETIVKGLLSVGHARGFFQNCGYNAYHLK